MPKENYKTGAEQTRTSKKWREDQVPQRSEDPLLTGHTYTLLFVEKFVDKQAIMYDLTISMSVCMRPSGRLYLILIIRSCFEYIIMLYRQCFDMMAITMIKKYYDLF